MRNFFLAFLCLIAVHEGKAQSDSLNLDLGRISLKKNSVQSITVQAKDLQQMPFANLSEAINVWFNGALTNRNNVLFIVDGNPLMDVNVLSIYDIEEVTLVQDATSVYMTYGPRQLILVKTKRIANTKPLETAVQGYFVSHPQYNPLTNKTNSSKKEIYHQYYLGYRKSVEGTSFGISANYLHDVSPRPKDLDLSRSKPFQLNRFRFNGYANQRIGSSTTFDLLLNYTPQQVRSELEYAPTGVPSIASFSLNQKNNVFNGGLNLRTSFGKGWFNHFSAAYNSYNLNTNSDNNYSLGNDQQTDIKDSTLESKSWWFRNQIGYIAKVGKWHFHPTLNVVYRKINEQFNAQDVSTRNNTVTNISGYNSSQKGDILQAIPSMQVEYKNLLAVQVGLQQSLKKQPDNFKNFTPFVTASANLVRLFKEDAAWDLKTHVSYAISNNFGDVYHAPNDLNHYHILDANGFTTINNRYNGIKQLQFGATASFINNKVLFSYNRLQVKNKEQLRMQLPGGTPPMFVFIEAEARTVIDRAGVDLKAIDDADLKWTTGLHVNSRSLKFISGQTTPGNEQPKEWTGGWVNRMQYHSFSLQADLLYWLNRRWFNAFVTPQQMEKMNSFSLQNLSVGYHWKYVEVYAGVRNLFENKKMPVVDGRRYYGGGIKMMF